MRNGRAPKRPTGRPVCWHGDDEDHDGCRLGYAWQSKKDYVEAEVESNIVDFSFSLHSHPPTNITLIAARHKWSPLTKDRTVLRPIPASQEAPRLYCLVAATKMAGTGYS